MKDSILIGLNNRDPKWHDVYRLDLTTGALKEVWRNPGGYAGVVADRKLNLVLAQKSNPDGGFSYERFGPGQTLTKAFQYGLDDSQTTSVIAAPNSGRVYMLDSRGRDTAALTTLDLASGRSSVLAQDPRADISSATEDPRTGELLAYSVDYLTSRWTALSPSVQGDIAFLDRETRAMGGAEPVARQPAVDHRRRPGDRVARRLPLRPFRQAADQAVLGPAGAGGPHPGRHVSA